MTTPAAVSPDPGFAVLEGQGPFPGAQSGGTTRLHGRYATLSLATFVTLNCFHWEIEFQQEFADATAHGDFWRVRIPLTQDWSGRVQGYLDRSTGAIAAATSYLGKSAALAADPAPLTLNLYSNDGSLGANTQFFTGTCWVQRGSVIVPQAMVTQTVELVSAAVPTVVF